MQIEFSSFGEGVPMANFSYIIHKTLHPTISSSMDVHRREGADRPF